MPPVLAENIDAKSGVERGTLSYTSCSSDFFGDGVGLKMLLSLLRNKQVAPETRAANPLLPKQVPYIVMNCPAQPVPNVVRFSPQWGGGNPNCPRLIAPCYRGCDVPVWLLLSEMANSGDP